MTSPATTSSRTICPPACPSAYYEPTEEGHEAKIKRRMEARRAADASEEADAS